MGVAAEVLLGDGADAVGGGFDRSEVVGIAAEVGVEAFDAEVGVEEIAAAQAVAHFVAVGVVDFDVAVAGFDAVEAGTAFSGESRGGEECGRNDGGEQKGLLHGMTPCVVCGVLMECALYRIGAKPRLGAPP